MLTPGGLDRESTVYNFYVKERDAYLPGKNPWLTETGEGSCGGDTWAAESADSFRLLTQFGSLAQKSVKNIMYSHACKQRLRHAQRRNFWSRGQTIGPLFCGSARWEPDGRWTPGMPAKNVRIYAQCMKDSNGGVTLMVLNMDKTSEALLKLPVAGERYSLSSTDIFGQTVRYSMARN